MRKDVVRVFSTAQFGRTVPTKIYDLHIHAFQINLVWRQYLMAIKSYSEWFKIEAEIEKKSPWNRENRIITKLKYIQ